MLESMWIVFGQSTSVVSIVPPKFFNAQICGNLQSDVSFECDGTLTFNNIKT